jgi:hypothetical protein
LRFSTVEDEQRICGAFNIHQLGPGLTALDYSRGLRWRKREINPSFRQNIGDEGVGAPVNIILDDRMVARLKNSHQNRRDRRHPGTEEEAGLAAFQVLQFVNDRLLVGNIKITRIDPFIRPQVFKDRGGKNRGIYPLGAGIDIGAGVNAFGGGFQVRCSLIYYCCMLPLASIQPVAERRTEPAEVCPAEGGMYRGAGHSVSGGMQ